MNQKLGFLTLFFSMMAIENTFRVIDFIQGWQYKIPPAQPDNVDFDSDYDIKYPEQKRETLESF